MPLPIAAALGVYLVVLLGQRVAELAPQPRAARRARCGGTARRALLDVRRAARRLPDRARGRGLVGGASARALAVVSRRLARGAGAAHRGDARARRALERAHRRAAGRAAGRARHLPLARAPELRRRGARVRVCAARLRRLAHGGGLQRAQRVRARRAHPRRGARAPRGGHATLKRRLCFDNCCRHGQCSDPGAWRALSPPSCPHTVREVTAASIVPPPAGAGNATAPTRAMPPRTASSASAVATVSTPSARRASPPPTGSAAPRSW